MNKDKKYLEERAEWADKEILLYEKTYGALPAYNKSTYRRMLEKEYDFNERGQVDFIRGADDGEAKVPLFTEQELIQEQAI